MNEEKAINGERVLWSNHYLGLAITEKFCGRCGGDLSIYGTNNGAKLLYTDCNIEWGEMLPTITEFVNQKRAEDDAPTRTQEEVTQ